MSYISNVHHKGYIFSSYSFLNFKSNNTIDDRAKHKNTKHLPSELKSFHQWYSGTKEFEKDRYKLSK